MEDRYYAVRLITGEKRIAKGWEELAQITKNFPVDTKVNLFPDYESAYNFIYSNLTYKKKEAVAYVDGSYNRNTGYWGYGVILFPKDDEDEHWEFSGKGNKYNQHWNIAGELYASAIATREAIAKGFNELTICYDYEGIEYLVTGKWKIKSELSNKYALTMRDYINFITLHFEKVKAHSGDRFNEMVDKLARKACCGDED